ncbi:hypothetical protein OC835_007920 [Tilletia horrida]|nr:hypothetical protein OC835_007920 [Tilletia horrida]
MPVRAWVRDPVAQGLVRYISAKCAVHTLPLMQTNDIMLAQEHASAAAGTSAATIVALAASQQSTPTSSRLQSALPKAKGPAASPATAKKTKSSSIKKIIQPEIKKKGKEKAAATSPAPRWKRAEDEVLLSYLAAVKAQGLSSGGSFKTPYFQKAADDINKKCKGSARIMSQARTRYKTMKSIYTIVHRIASKSGFGWDAENNVVEASEDMWDTLREEDPGSADWQGKELWYYNAMHSLTGSEVATGEYGFDAAHGILGDADEEAGPEDQDLDTEEDVEKEEEEDDDDEEEEEREEDEDIIVVSRYHVAPTCDD